MRRLFHQSHFAPRALYTSSILYHKVLHRNCLQQNVFSRLVFAPQYSFAPETFYTTKKCTPKNVYTASFYRINFLHHKPMTPHVCLPFAMHNFHTLKVLHFLFYTTKFCTKNCFYTPNSFYTRNILHPMVPQQCEIAIYRTYIQASDMQTIYKRCSDHLPC